MGLGDGVGTGNLAIEARGLVKRFDGALAVDGVDLAVPEGAIYGILGPNGAGKTTTLRMLIGIIEPDAGERRVLGHTDPQAIARAIGYLPEERGLYPSMKTYEAIAFMGALRGLPLAEGRKRGRELLALDGAGFRGLFAGSPIKRIGRDRLVRNCLIAAGNSGNRELEAPVRGLLGDLDPTVAEAAEWALERLTAVP